MPVRNGANPAAPPGGHSTQFAPAPTDRAATAAAGGPPRDPPDPRPAAALAVAPVFAAVVAARFEVVEGAEDGITGKATAPPAAG